jgi:hypothetical protein
MVKPVGQAFEPDRNGARTSVCARAPVRLESVTYDFLHLKNKRSQIGRLTEMVRERASARAPVRLESLTYDFFASEE